MYDCILLANTAKNIFPSRFSKEIVINWVICSDSLGMKHLSTCYQHVGIIPFLHTTFKSPQNLQALCTINHLVLVLTLLSLYGLSPISLFMVVLLFLISSSFAFQHCLVRLIIPLFIWNAPVRNSRDASYK